jgi:hypothetical protein
MLDSCRSLVRLADAATAMNALSESGSASRWCWSPTFADSVGPALWPDSVAVPVPVASLESDPALLWCLRASSVRLWSPGACPRRCSVERWG